MILLGILIKIAQAWNIKNSLGNTYLMFKFSFFSDNGESFFWRLKKRNDNYFNLSIELNVY